MKALHKKHIILILTLFVIYSVDINGQIAWNWAKSFGIDRADASDMAVDSQGHIYIVGESKYGENQFIPNLVYDSGGFIAKFDSAGTLLWVKETNSDNDIKLTKAIAIDRNQNIYVTGYKSAPDCSTTGYKYLNKYSNDGNELWHRKLDDFHCIDIFNEDSRHKTIGLINNVICVSGQDSIYSFSSSGNLIASKKLSFNCVNDDGLNYFYTAKDNQIFVLDTLLSIKNTYNIDSAGYKINALTIKGNAIYITGYFDTLKTGSWHMFVAKLDSQGNILWSKTGNGENDFSRAQGNAIILDKQNKIYIAGSCDGSVKFDSISIGMQGTGSGFVSRYNDSTGNLEDIIIGINDAGVSANSLAINSNNYPTVVGTLRRPTYVSTSFGEIKLDFEGATNFFIASVYKPDLSAILKGQVVLNNESQKSFIEIFRNNGDSTFTTIYRGQTDDSGKFNYTVNKKGSFLVKTKNFNQVGTYYKQTYLWSLADQINITKDTIIDKIDIDILECDPLTGEDSISGKIYSSDGTLKRFIDILLVTSDDQLVSYTQSDTLGNYCFANVPIGQYKILVDSSGTYMDSYYAINNSLKSASISAFSGKAFNNCDYIFGNDHKIYKKAIYTAINNENLQFTFDVNPNPARTFMNINTLTNRKDLVLQIFDVIGNCVYKINLLSQFSTIDISFLSEGIYFLKIENQTVKLIKM